MELLVLVIALLVAGTTLWLVLQGAPYVPTKRSVIAELFSQNVIRRKDVVYDLGAGDGRVMLESMQHSARKVYGIELNPLLFIICKLRLSKTGDRTVLLFGDFWKTPFPDDVTVVFVFLAGPFMKRLEKTLSNEATRLGRPIRLISYGFLLPNTKASQRVSACNIYDIQP